MNEYRKPSLIQTELEELQELIDENELLISKYPQDFALKLNLDSFENRKQFLLEELSKSLSHFNMDTFSIVIEKDYPPIDEVMDIMHRVQELFHTLAAQADKGKAMDRGAHIPPDIKTISTLGLEKAKVGCLRLYFTFNPLKTDSQSKFITVIKQATDNLNTLISCGTDKKLIKEQTKNLGSQSIDRYKNLLETIFKHKSDLRLFEEEINTEYEPKKLSDKFAESVYQVIVDSKPPETEDIDIEGELGIINIFLHVFTVKTELRQVDIEFDDFYIDEVKSRLKQNVKVKVKLTKTYHELQDKMDEEYKLIRFLD